VFSVCIMCTSHQSENGRGTFIACFKQERESERISEKLKRTQITEKGVDLGTLEFSHVPLNTCLSQPMCSQSSCHF